MIRRVLCLVCVCLAFVIPAGAAPAAPNGCAYLRVGAGAAATGVSVFAVAGCGDATERTLSLCVTDADTGRELTCIGSEPAAGTWYQLTGGCQRDDPPTGTARYRVRAEIKDATGTVLRSTTAVTVLPAWC